MKHNDWTEQLRQRLNDAEVPAPENLWDSISQQLDAQGQQQDAEDAQVAKKPRSVVALGSSGIGGAHSRRGHVVATA